MNMTSFAGVYETERWGKDCVSFGGTRKRKGRLFVTTYPAVSALVILIKSPHTQSTDMACPVVARGDGLVDDGAGAYEADLGLDIVIVVVVAIFPGSSSGPSGPGCRRDGSGAQLGFR